MLHQIPRPNTVNEGSIPSLSWRRVVTRETKGRERVLVDPILVIGWGNKIELIKVLLTPKVEVFPRFSLEFVPLNGYTVDAEISGVQWLGVNVRVIPFQKRNSYSFIHSLIYSLIVFIYNA